jgi:DNA-binding NarL/FixJ family response regulator
MPVRILIADDHDVVRAGIKMILNSRNDWEICGEASDGGEAVEKAESLNPDAVVLDVTMPRLNGLQAAEKIAQLPGINRVLIFTMHDSDSIARAAKQAGAKGVVVKAFAARDLVRALDAVLAGGSFFADDASGKKSDESTGHPRLDAA